MSPRTTEADEQQQDDSTMSAIKAMGMSAHERDVRDRLSRCEQTMWDTEPFTLPIGLVCGLIRDIEMWRHMVTNEIDKFSFDGLIAMSKLILDTIYPDTMFTGECVGVARVAEIIAKNTRISNVPRSAAHIIGIEDAAHAIVDLMHANSGVRFVVLLRTLIDEIETRPNRRQLSALDRGGWRDMGEAPLDGTWVLGFETRTGMNSKYSPQEVMRWHRSRAKWINSAHHSCAPIAWKPLDPDPAIVAEK